jgi:hypothetical protein
MNNIKVQRTKVFLSSYSISIDLGVIAIVRGSL